MFEKTKEKLTEPVRNAASIAVTALVIAIVALIVGIAGYRHGNN
jgi:hypothetical protein